MIKVVLFLASFAFSMSLFAGTADDNQTWMRAPLRFQTVQNLATEGSMIRLRREYRQLAGEPIIFEAEEATLIELLDTGKRIGSDPDASGGHYLDFVKCLEFQFEVSTPGDYQIRLRSWFPLKAGYNHNERMNDGELRVVIDSQFGEAQDWRWTEGLVYALKKGTNRYVFPSPAAFCGGARLDKVALLPVGQTAVTRLGPAASSITGGHVGEAVSRRVNLARVSTWRLNFEVTENGGKAEVSYSYDKIAWQSITPGQIMTVPDPKPGYLYFKFGIEGVAGRPSPWIQGLAFYVELEKKP